MAREFDRDLKLLVLDQPTRGLDVGSIEFIHRQAIAKRDAGTAVLLVSAELDEVLELSDRIGVMYRGELVADRRRPDRRQASEVGLLMATGGRGEAADADDRRTPRSVSAHDPPASHRRQLLAARVGAIVLALRRRRGRHRSSRARSSTGELRPRRCRSRPTRRSSQGSLAVGQRHRSTRWSTPRR